MEDKENQEPEAPTAASEGFLERWSSTIATGLYVADTLFFGFLAGMDLASGNTEYFLSRGMMAAFAGYEAILFSREARQELAAKGPPDES